MLKYSRAALPWCALALMVSAIAWGATFSPSYRKCISNYARQESEYKEANLDQAVGSGPRVYGLPAFLLCEGKFIGENSETLTALATIAIAGFTLTLWRATTEQGRLTRQSIELARLEFISTHRPRIILREAIIGSVLEDKPITVLFTLANIGDTPGTVVRSWVGVERVNEQIERAFILPSIEPHNELGVFRLSPGQQVMLKPPDTKEMPKWIKKDFGVRPDFPQARNYTIHLAGQIIYQDDAGISRRTVFRRVLIPERQRFYSLNGEFDLDYAD